MKSIEMKVRDAQIRESKLRDTSRIMRWLIEGHPVSNHNHHFCYVRHPRSRQCAQHPMGVLRVATLMKKSTARLTTSFSKPFGNFEILLNVWNAADLALTNL